MWARWIAYDETPVQMLAPGEKKTHRSYVWAYSSTAYAGLKSVVYDFSPSRAGEHARNFLGDWRRKFFDLHAASKSQLAEQALLTIGAL